MGMKAVLGICAAALFILGGLSWQVTREVPPSFDLVVWDHHHPLPGAAHLYAEYLAHVIEDFQRDHPHYRVTLKLLHRRDGLHQLERELAVGHPPDVFGATVADRRFDRLLPAGAPGQLTGYWPAAISALTGDGQVWAHPRWLGWELWAVNRRLLSDEVVALLPAWQRGGWGWQEAELAAGSRPLGVDLTLPALWRSALESSGGSPRSLQYTPGQLAQVARTFSCLIFAGVLPPAHAAPGTARIERFFRGQTPILGPVNPFLARYLEERLASRTAPVAPAPAAADLVWLPMPSFGVQPFIPWQVSAYYVFVRPGPGGKQRAAAAAQLAAYLARRMGRWGAEHLGVIPAYRTDLALWALESGLPASLRVAITGNLGRALEPLAGGGEAAFWDRAYDEVLVPGLVKALTSPLPPDLGETLRQKLLELANRP